MPRLRRADCSGPGFRRVRRGRGFTYLDEDDQPIDEPDVVERLRSLGIPPAWKDVWICPWAHGHIQATGVDAAGRKQYLYHPEWRTRRDAEKFDEMLSFAKALPDLRSHVAQQLEASEELTRERTPVRFERSIHVPEDEICFFVFDAPSSRDAALAAERAGLDPMRIVEAVSSPEDKEER